MRSKISLKWPLLIASIAGIAFLSIIIFFPTLDLSVQGSYTKPASPTGNQTPQNLIESKSAESIQSIAFPEQASSSLPIRLKIPKIHVDAAIKHVGLTPQEAMDVPKGPADVAWFNLGPRPGEKGSAVISGHYGWKNDMPAVFDNLYKLRKGDKLYVEDEKGTTTTFVVRESRRYDPNADASSVFGSNDGKPHLNLITCEGVWNKVSKSYSKRLVVFTDKE